MPAAKFGIIFKKRKNMKKIISMVIILVMCLGLVACGENSKDYKSAVRHLEFFWKTLVGDIRKVSCASNAC